MERERTERNKRKNKQRREKQKHTHTEDPFLDPQCCCGRLFVGPMGSQMVWAPLPRNVSHKVDIFVQLFVPHIVKEYCVDHRQVT